MTSEEAPPGAAAISSILRQMGDSLEASSYWRLPKAERDLHLRHACFVREMAHRKKFCRELAKIAIRRAMPPYEVRSKFDVIFRKYPFPSKSPYALDHWTAILAAARLGDLEAIPNFRGGRMVATILRKFEVQFLCEQPIGLRDLSSGQLRLLSIVAAFDASVFSDNTRGQVRNELVRVCGGALDDFHGWVTGLINGAPLGEFTVRLLLRTWEPPYEAGPYSLEAVLSGPARASTDSLVTSFTVSMLGNDRDADLADVIERLLDGLETIAPFSPEVGRRPKITLDARKRAMYDPAKWWAMHALDGLTVDEIAKKEVGYDEAAPDAAEKHDEALKKEGTITKALQRMGVPLRTK